MISMPILPNVPVQPSLRIGNGSCPTNMPPPAPTAVPLGERSVNVVRASVPAARTLTPQEQRGQQKDVRKALATFEEKNYYCRANQRERQIMSVQPLLTTTGDGNLLFALASFARGSSDFGVCRDHLGNCCWFGFGQCGNCCCFEQCGRKRRWSMHIAGDDTIVIGVNNQSGWRLVSNSTIFWSAWTWESVGGAI
jgi:hypothetical protein